MTIQWVYLNKDTATIDALKDYCGMKHILLSYSDDVTETQEYLSSIHTPMLSWNAPGLVNPHATDGSIARSLDLIDVLKDRYQQALEYMAWFLPAWNVLSEEERFILSEFFMKDGVKKTEVISKMIGRLNIERAQVYRQREKAIRHLSLLLYGK